MSKSVPCIEKMPIFASVFDAEALRKNKVGFFS